ncbi:MAG: NAD-dependent epimerase/dehydratase family protein [Acidobacteria bacterium]|nr:NAD-dependent epimerase/dehydratase family protein [Acidobacteriota bacterium]
MITILGAGGSIGNELAPLLAAAGRRFRLVGRQPREIFGGECYAADLTDLGQTVRAVEGSEIAVLAAGLKYDVRVWAELWPRIMQNSVEACKRAGARLVFVDNVYMYGRVEGAMTEETPLAPCSKKGEIRARIAAGLMEQVKGGGLTAMIARSADFYGPGKVRGVPNLLVMEAMAKRSTPAWLMNARVPHSLTYTPDAARGVAMLMERESAWNQVWHLPTAAPAPTGEEFVEMAARVMGRPAKFRVYGKAMLRMVGWFNSEIRESMEMLYQNEAGYVFDSGKFAREFGFAGTPYAEGVRRSCEWLQTGK